MKQFYKFTLLLLALILPTVATAHDFEVDGIYYNITSDNEVAVTYQGTDIESAAYSGNVVIPETVTYNGVTYSVTTIDEGAFYVCTDLTSISIPNTITCIRWYSFYGCTSLKIVNLPGSITNIEEYTFSECSSLTSVSIPSSVTTIAEGAFMGCSALTSIGLPSSVVSIADYAFVNCNSLITVYSFINPENISMGYGVFYLEGYSYNTDYSFRTLYVLPGYSNGYQQDVWGWFGFNCNIVEMNPVKVDGIYYKFINDNEVAVTSGNEYYTGEVNIPETISLGGVTFSVSTIDRTAFSYCSELTSVVIPKSVTSINVQAFSGCNSLSSIVVASDNPTYDSRENCNAIIRTASNELIVGCQNTVIPNTVTSIGERAFYECSSLTEIVIPNSVISIDKQAFRYCSSLSSISISNSVTSIGDYAFSGCTGLTSVNIPNSVTTFGTYVFYNCRGLTTATFSNPTSSIAYGIFCNCTGLKNVIIPNSVTEIKGEAFLGCTSLESISLPNSVTTIGYAAFRESGLMSIVIPGSVQTIGEKVFMNCENLTDVTLSEGLLLIDEEAFSKCGISEIQLPESLVRIGEQAFEHTFLTSITIPKNVAYLGNEDEDELYGDVFNGCLSLTEVNVDELNTTYVSCDGMLLTKDMQTLLYYPRGKSGECVIPNAVTTIYKEAFYRCDGLTSVTIPKSVEYIAYDAFYGCYALSLVRVFAITPPTVVGDSFDSYSYEVAVLEVPESSVDAYRNHQYWGRFQIIQPISEAAGDVDGDGNVTIGDVTNLIDLLLNGGVSVTQYPNADVDGDGNITIGDVTKIIDMLLGN